MAAIPKKPYKKLAESPTQLVNRIEQRGLTVDANEKNTLYSLLQTVGYYRFTGFCLPFQHKNRPNKGKFLPGITLRRITALYEFDTELRALCGQALEKIEVYVRNVICDYMARRHNPHWYVDPKCILSDFQSLKSTAESNVYFDPATSGPTRAFTLDTNVFLYHYYKTYDDPAIPPAWMHRECASFGYWAKVLKAVSTADGNSIASSFSYPNRKQIDAVVLKNWCHSISIFRNRCAHHARITYRTFPFPPIVPSNPCGASFGTRQDDLRSIFLVIVLLLKHIEPTYDWRARLHRLITHYAGDVQIEIATSIGKAENDWTKDLIWSV